MDELLTELAREYEELCMPMKCMSSDNLFDKMWNRCVASFYITDSFEFDILKYWKESSLILFQLYACMFLFRR